MRPVGACAWGGVTPLLDGFALHQVLLDQPGYHLGKNIVVGDWLSVSPLKAHHRRLTRLPQAVHDGDMGVDLALVQFLHDGAHRLARARCQTAIAHPDGKRELCGSADSESLNGLFAKPMQILNVPELGHGCLLG